MTIFSSFFSAEIHAMSFCNTVNFFNVTLLNKTGYSVDRI